MATMVPVLEKKKYREADLEVLRKFLVQEVSLSSRGDPGTDSGMPLKFSFRCPSLQIRRTPVDGTHQGSHVKILT
jgi:hypothetical protein